ncbi:MAG: patatin-like phospholipase family protein [Deltaproteobacteria bacterium]|jgi:NTE family protein|nr:patatin-like phospholipase family protein [Deltaproteobacteria bacterium]
MSQIALILSGGGARGSYQAGVVQGIHEVLKAEKIPMKIDQFSGVSAGAINASFLAAEWQDPENAVKKLVDLWSQIRSEDVYNTGAVSLGKIGLQWMGELSFGGLTGSSTPGRALLDTDPLKEFLHKKLNVANIKKNLDAALFSSLIITAVDYSDSTAVSFIQSSKPYKSWQKQRRVSESAEITHDHVLCSSAIPLLFPPRPVGRRYFGDGCVRNSHPCGPSIYLGAEKIVVIGVKSKSYSSYNQELHSLKTPPSVARVINVLLNAVLLDNVEHDVERMERMNQIVSQVSFDKPIPYKKMDYVFISPSKDIGVIASRHSKKVSRLIRYLIKGLGSLDEANELLSYLLFESTFCSELIELGFQDAFDNKDSLIKLFST